MPLNLNDLIKKAEDKGIVKDTPLRKTSQLVRPWQQESVLFQTTQSQGQLENQQESEDKVTQLKRQKNTNRAQSSSKQLDNKLTTNHKQIGNKVGTICVQTDNNSFVDLETNSKQSGNIMVPEPYSMLVGLQREIIILIFEECQRANSRITDSLTLEYIALSLKRTSGSVKTSIQRLEKKGYLNRVQFKNGRGGWSRYGLSEILYQEITNKTGNK